MSMMGGGFGGPTMPDFVGQSAEAFAKVADKMFSLIHRFIHKMHKPVDNGDIK